MKRLSDYQGFFESKEEVLRRLLKAWTPSGPGLDEKAYETELFSWLKAQLPGVAMKAQYGIAWGTADIVIEDTYLIELKLAFTAKSVGEFDRCLGQLWRYKEKWVTAKSEGRVWLIMVGEAEAEFHHLIEAFFKEMNGHFFSTRFEWIERAPKA